MNYIIGSPVESIVVKPKRSYSIGSNGSSLAVEQRNDVVIPKRVSKIDHSSGKPKRVVVSV